MTAGFSHLLMHIVPYLGGDEEVFSLHHALVKEAFQHLTDLGLVLINGGAVDEAVAKFYCSVHGLGNRFRAVFVRAEGTKTNCRNLLPCIKLPFRNLVLINFFNYYLSPSVQSLNTTATLPHFPPAIRL